MMIPSRVNAANSIIPRSCLEANPIELTVQETDVTNSPKSRAAVEPRARGTTRSNWTSTLLLTDIISELIDSQTTAVRLTGEGKTSAIRHLRDHFADYPGVRFIDDSQPVNNIADWKLTVFSAPSYVRGNLELVIARWWIDDCIEYLIAKAPQHCKSVMARLIEADDLWLTSGSPRVTAICLDIMSDDESIESIESAIVKHLDSIEFKRASHRARVIKKCHEHLLNDAAIGIELQRFVPRFLDQQLVKFLSVQTVRYVLAAKQLAKDLAQHKTPNCLQQTWPPAWIEYFADTLCQTEHPEAIEFLNDLSNNAHDRNSSNAASVLFKRNANWRPRRQSSFSLCGVQLSGFEAIEFSVEDSLITNADFSNAILPSCNLKKSIATGTDFSNADLSHSNLELFTGKHANFCSATLRNVNANKTKFDDSIFTNAILDFGDFSHADFCNSDLSGASFKSTKLHSTDFSGCQFNDTILAGATLEQAILESVDLRNAQIQKTEFRYCLMHACNLEDHILQEIIFEGCDLHSALLSNSQLDRCALNHCNLSNAKLGAIVWTDCDLTKANFTGCHFFYGSTRSGLVGSPYPSHGTRTGFYTDDYDDHHFKRIEDIRKASLQGCDLTDAKVEQADFYLVDLRGAKYDAEQLAHFQKCGAILTD